MSLQAKLDAVKADFERQVSDETAAILHQATEALIATGQAQRALKAGDRAPAFTLPDPDSKQVALSTLLKKGPVVLTFYRGVWCPYCNLDLQALEAAALGIRARGASIIAISQQTAPNSRKSQRDNGLSFPILSDAGGEIGAAFGIRWTASAALQAIHKQLGADITTFNGESSWTLPMPARYVIAPDGIIAYAEINPDYTRRPEPSDLFPTLEKLRIIG